MTRQTTARRNIYVLTTAQALGAASPPIIVSLGGLVGQQLSEDPALVTLPVSLFNLGLALGTLPSAAVMRRFGRRSGYVLGAGFGIASGLVAAFGIFSASAPSLPDSTPPMCRAIALPPPMRSRGK